MMMMMMMKKKMTKMNKMKKCSTHQSSVKGDRRVQAPRCLYTHRHGRPTQTFFSRLLIGLGWSIEAEATMGGTRSWRVCHRSSSAVQERSQIIQSMSLWHFFGLCKFFPSVKLKKWNINPIPIPWCIGTAGICFTHRNALPVQGEYRGISSGAQLVGGYPVGKEVGPSGCSWRMYYYKWIFLYIV